MSRKAARNIRRRARNRLRARKVLRFYSDVTVTIDGKVFIPMKSISWTYRIGEGVHR